MQIDGGDNGTNLRSFVEFVRGGRNYYAYYLNGPALRRMVGDVDGKRVLDVGCGEGYFTRMFAEAGASVVGVDLSEALIAAALEEEKRRPLGVKYLVADAADMSALGSGSFDVAYCHMALDDIPDYEGAIGEVSRVLVGGGRFVAVIQHPCFSVRSMDERMVGGWETRLREDGAKEYLYYRVEDYLTRHSHQHEWKHDRLTGSFVTTGFHRTLSDYVNALVRNGLAIVGLEEPTPLEEGVRRHPPMAKHYRVPFSLAIDTVKR
jgi:ubiquinone/menaquinone biosynthesis C-methylase UbiE